jgi:hypothetical protein
MPGAISVAKAKRALRDKGFQKRDGVHERYRFFNERGERTGGYTFFSVGGRKSAEIGPSMMKRMQRQLRLASVKEVADLLNCPMTHAEYAEREEQHSAAQTVA